MTYKIISTQTSKVSLADDNLSISVDMTITYGIEGAEKMQPSSVGCTIELSLEIGERNTLVSELETKTAEWFEENFNV